MFPHLSVWINLKAKEDDTSSATNIDIIMEVWILDNVMLSSSEFVIFEIFNIPMCIIIIEGE